MKNSIKYILVLIIVLITGANSLNAQFRMGNCGSNSDKSTIYLTFYGGYGFGKYRMNHSLFQNRIIENTSQYQFGASLHYKLGQSNIGIGLDYNGIKNDFEQLQIENYKTNILNMYLNYEYNIYSGHFYDFGFGLGAGYAHPMNLYNNEVNNNIPINIHGSFFTNFVLNSYSAIVVRAGYNYYILDNTIAEHQISSVILQAGFRMWFNF